MPVVVTINSYLASLEETRNIKLSVKQLAKESGISQPTLSKIANNHIDGLSRRKLAAIIAALRAYDAGVTVGDLVRWVE